MFYEITTVIGCRNNCSYCPQKRLIKSFHENETTSRPTVLSLENFKKIINKIPVNIEINFAGFCEPFQNPDCVDMAIYAHQKGHLVRIYTTLHDLNPAALKKLLKYIPFNNPGDACFVVHLPSKSEYKHIATNKDYLETLNVLIDSKVNVNFSYLGDNLLPPKIESLFKKKHIHIHYGQLISRAGNINIQNVDIPLVKKNKIRCENRINNTRGHIILPDGRIALCCMDYGLNHILGNLLTDTYKSIENGPEFKKILQGLNENKSDILCHHCELATEVNNLSISTIKNPNYWQNIKTQTKKIILRRLPKLYTLLQKAKYLVIPFQVSDQKTKIH